MSIVTLALAKECLQIAHSKQDNYIQALLDGAEAFLAAQLNIQLASQTFTENLPNGSDNSAPFLYNQWRRADGDAYLLPSRRPVTALTSVLDLWNDSASESALLAAGDLVQRVDGSGRPLGNWPRGEQRYQVSYTAGYATLPAALQQAVLMLVSRAYSARGGETGGTVAGEKTAFGALLHSDIMLLIRPYSHTRQVAL